MVSLNSCKNKSDSDKDSNKNSSSSAQGAKPNSVATVTTTGSGNDDKVEYEIITEENVIDSDLSVDEEKLLIKEDRIYKIIKIVNRKPDASKDCKVMDTASLSPSNNIVFWPEEGVVQGCKTKSSFDPSFLSEIKEIDSLNFSDKLVGIQFKKGRDSKNWSRVDPIDVSIIKRQIKNLLIVRVAKLVITFFTRRLFICALLKKKYTSLAL